MQTVCYFGSPDVEMPTFIEWVGPGLAWYSLGPVGHGPGVKVGDHHAGRAVDPWKGPFEVDELVVRRTAVYAERRFPGLDPVRSETCLYTNTPDEHFLLDRVGPLVIGSPCSGHGFKFAPLVGEMLAYLVLGDGPVPLDRFSLGRFTAS